jgi:hypothetical protein
LGSSSSQSRKKSSLPMAWVYAASTSA